MIELVLTFVGVTTASLTCLYLAPKKWRSTRHVVKHRMEEEFPSNDRQQEVLRPTSALALSPRDEYELLINNPADGTAKRRKISLSVAEYIHKANVRITPGQLGLLCAGMGGCLAFLGWLIAAWSGTALGLMTGLILPLLVIQIRKNARQQRLQKQLPSAFELMARVIRSGQSVPQALEAIAEGFDEPLRSEFNNCLQQQALGLSADIVFQEMARKNDIIELRLFAMGMSVQRQMGGNLTELLERLASLVRARMKLQQQIRTLTAEGRLQGITLSVIPIVLLIAMYFLNRNYALTLFQHPDLLIGTGTLMLIGLLWIRYITKVR